jgi:hypothetical protein
MGRSSVKLDPRVNQPLKVVKRPLNPFCGMSAWSGNRSADKWPRALFTYYCLYNHYNKCATEWFVPARAGNASNKADGVRTASQPGFRGFDAGKKIKGRKRHVLVDTLGYLLALRVTPVDVSLWTPMTQSITRTTTTNWGMTLNTYGALLARGLPIEVSLESDGGQRRQG